MKETEVVVNQLVFLATCFKHNDEQDNLKGNIDLCRSGMKILGEYSQRCKK